MSNGRKPRNPAAAAGGLPDEQLLTACAELLPRLGAVSFETRYSEPEHEGSPVVWLCIGEFKRRGRSAFEVGAGFDPSRAAYRLCEQLVDGGQCQHCNRRTGITDDFTPMPGFSLVCWYQLDPELGVFRRSCA